MYRKLPVYMLAIIFFIILFSGCGQGTGGKETVIVFHAGSLSVPLKRIAEEYEKINPGVNIQLEGAGSVDCARKITDLNKPCDIMASADYRVIETMLIPGYASWDARFASNSMVIAYTGKSGRAGEINDSNWIDILLDDNIYYGRSDPDSDPCGYRSVITMKLAEDYYGRDGITEKLLAKDRNFIRPKETDLVALLETNSIDYIFQYRSVAVQHSLRYLELPDEIDLSDSRLDSLYERADVRITGTAPGEYITVTGSNMVYGVTLLDNAPDRDEAIRFLQFMIGRQGLDIIESDGQKIIEPPIVTQFDKLPGELKLLCREK